jgi:hypothetical protein
MHRFILGGRLSHGVMRAGMNAPKHHLITKTMVQRTFATEPVRIRLPEDDAAQARLRSITKWFKKEGDEIKIGEPLCEVDAGEVVYDFNSPISGFVVRITAKEGSSDLKGELSIFLNLLYHFADGYSSSLA